MARLPQPGGDVGTWGDILNDFLSQVHKPNGTLKDSTVTASALVPGSVTSAALADDAVTNSSILDGSLTEALFDAGVQAQLSSIAGKLDSAALDAQTAGLVAQAGSDTRATLDDQFVDNTTLIIDVGPWLMDGSATCGAAHTDPSSWYGSGCWIDVRTWVAPSSEEYKTGTMTYAGSQSIGIWRMSEAPLADGTNASADDALAWEADSFVAVQGETYALIYIDWDAATDIGATFAFEGLAPQSRQTPGTYALASDGTALSPQPLSVKVTDGTWDENVAVGPQAQHGIAPGVSSGNVAVGSRSQSGIAGGVENVGIGVNVQQNLDTGSNNNIAIGSYVQQMLNAGQDNIGIGTSTHTDLTSGSQNIAMGSNVQKSLTTGNRNIAMGMSAQSGITTGSHNIAFGEGANRNIANGTGNIAVGDSAQSDMVGGNYNVAIGNYADMSSTSGNLRVSIGANAGGASGNASIVAVGANAKADTPQGVSVGSQAVVQAGHTTSVALGANTTTTAASQVAIGSRDLEVQHATKGVVLRSPNGTRYRITVSDTGTLTTTVVV